MSLAIVYGALSGIATGIAFLRAEGALTAVGGALGLTFLILSCRCAPRAMLPACIAGLIAHSIGFYWLVTTISFFGSFPLAASLLIFALFITTSSIPYLVFAVVYRTVPSALDRLALAAPLALTVSEFLPVRIFPWSFGHSQAGFPALAQLAEIGGVPLVAFILALACDFFARVIERVSNRSSSTASRLAPAFATSALCCALALTFGASRLREFKFIPGQALSVVVPQANVSIEEKHDRLSFAQNAARYQELTTHALVPGALVVWPETVIQEWIPTNVGDVTRAAQLPRSSTPASYLIGALTFDPLSPGVTTERMYNSALAIFGDGTVPTPYHKQILMPFGEYVPLGDTFPWLRTLSGVLGEFTRGPGVSVFRYPAINGDRPAPEFKASALICYEDIVPNLARAATMSGAELLVNITNDAWFGRTRAPFQHHLLAQFRAIENRRFLIRSTNTGFTAVVSPIGETIASLPIFSEETLLARVTPMRYKTLYTTIGDAPWWIVTFITALLVVRRLRSGT